MIINDYGTLYLSQERAKEFMSIVGKHHCNMMLELKENKFIPSFVSLAKTTVRELDDIIH